MDEKTTKDWVRKSISIKERQEEFIKEINLNLSRFVQNKLEDYMERHPDWEGTKEERGDDKGGK